MVDAQKHAVQEVRAGANEVWYPHSAMSEGEVRRRNAPLFSFNQVDAQKGEMPRRQGENREKVYI